MKHFYILIFLIFTFSSCVNSQKEDVSPVLIIDEESNKEIENKLSNSNNEYNCIIEYNRYENDDLVENNKVTNALSFTRIEKETATITGFSGIDEGFGFILLVNKDTCMIKCEFESTNEVFKLEKNHVPTFGLYVPCKYQKTTLIKKPKFESGEIIKGKIDLKSENFYEKINNEFKSVRIEMKAYFISEPMPLENGKYKTLIKK
ncbi:MAG: hypothetical protein V4666_01305 [Bacteroidota bacterium]